MTTESSAVLDGGWNIEQYGQYLNIKVEGKPGYITIKQEDEGFVVDIWPDVGNDSVASTCAEYNELAADEEDA